MAADSRKKRSKRCPGCGGLVTTAVCVGCKIIRDASDEKTAKEEMNPGGSKAVKLGCLCPVYENRAGKGHGAVPNQFIISTECKMHGKPPSKPKEPRVVATKADIPPPIPQKHWAIL